MLGNRQGQGERERAEACKRHTHIYTLSLCVRACQMCAVLFTCTHTERTLSFLPQIDRTAQAFYTSHSQYAVLICCRWQRHWFVVDHTSFRVRETRLAEGEDDYAAVADGEPDAVKELQRLVFQYSSSPLYTAPTTSCDVRRNEMHTTNAPHVLVAIMSGSAGKEPVTHYL
jgi:hypothetical protein